MEKYKKSVKWYVMIVLVLAAGILYSCRLPDSEKAVMQEGTQEEMRETEDTSLGEAAVGTEIYVYVSGCVKKPGVYQLSAGSRIYQAVEAAGGMTKKADAKECNLAEVLQDGEQIHIPSKSETEEQTKDKAEDTDDSITAGEKSGKTKSTKININTASKEELMTLTGIGEVKAQAIIAYRQSQGAFSQIRDLMKVEGIKEGSYTKIQDDICVE